VGKINTKILEAKLEIIITKKFDPNEDSEDSIETILIEEIYELLEDIIDDDRIEDHIEFTLRDVNNHKIKFRWKK